MNFVCSSHTSRKGGDVMAVKKELVDELLKDADPKKVFGSEGLLDEIKKTLAERMLNAELDEHLATARRRCSSIPASSIWISRATGAAASSRS
jgi:hypothetical protein